jgi:tRNA (guanosine-2'-O-)-methyltransferase
VDVKVHDNLPSGVDELRRQGKQILAAHFSERAVDYRQIDYTKPTTLIVGSEKIGVSEQAAELADEHVLIPMLGMVQSLNVSVASAIILYEAQRQRELAGLYDKQHLSSASFERLRFEWLHPQVKEFCLKHKIRYPKIDEQGDIRDEQWNQLRQSVTGH